MENKVLILMGSKKDLDFCKEIARYLTLFDLSYEFRIASAHKTPDKVSTIIRENETENVVYITVAGRSNALSAFVDANSSKPVIACPPYSEKFGGVDLYSSLRVPSGVGSLVTIEAEGAAIAAAKIFSLTNHKLQAKIKEYQSSNRKEIEKADESAKNMK